MDEFTLELTNPQTNTLVVETSYEGNLNNVELSQTSYTLEVLNLSTETNTIQQLINQVNDLIARVTILEQA
jgi:hypothetical protein